MRLFLSESWVQVFTYCLLVIVVPSIFLIVWILVSAILPIASPAIYIVFATAVLTAVIGVLLVRKPFDKLPSNKEIELAGSLSQYISLYRHSPVPYMTIDEKNRVVMYNLAAARLFQTNIDALAGVDLSERFTNDNENELSVLLGKLSAGVTINEMEAQITTEKEKLRWVMVSVFAAQNSKERLVALVDITHQKIVDAAKSEFVALATHQLRTPITAIRWNTELLSGTLNETKTEAQDGYLIKIDRNITRMLALINDFLSVSKLETGTFATKEETFNLQEFIAGVIDEYTSLISKKQLTVSPYYEPSSLSFTADTRLMHIIVSNLLSNAVKYTPDGGEVSIGYRIEKNMVTITVADQGIGIPDSELDQLFTKFFRATNAQTYRTEGTGLGLYIVKQSVEKLGGTIEVVSVEEQGTTFTVHLPVV